MKIGFIGFGKVSKHLFKLIESDDIEFVTSCENRSSKTIGEINNVDITVYDTFKEVAINSDILISATSPKSALDVAKNYGGYAKGIYLDLNNISPVTARQMDDVVGKLVKGAIIGKIDSKEPILYISGKYSNDLLFLNDFITTKKISEYIGDAAILKLLRSSYTKTLSALLIESYEIAKSHNMDDEFFDILSLTEGEDFREKSLSRIKNTISNKKRKSEELEEIIECFDENDLILVKAALKKLNQ